MIPNTGPFPAVSTPAPAPVPIPAPAKAEKERKFKLASKLNETIDASTIGEKIMDTTVEMPVRHILAAAPDVAGYLHEMTKRRQVPLAIPLDDAMVMQSITADTFTTQLTDPITKAGAAITKKFYALPSGRARVRLDDQFNVSGLLDNGSEVVMIPRRIHERLGIAIDTEIDWRINGYNSRTSEMLEDGRVIGCCHDASVDVGGIEVKVPIFVIEHSHSDIILGRPWERAVRAIYINEDDGSYTVIIKSQDGRRTATFTAVTAKHERNREYVRHAEDGEACSSHLKG